MSDLTIAQVLEHYGGDLTHVSEHGWRPIRCPFHTDRVKSASVNIEQNGFKCHGCEMKGDAIGLIMTRENLDFGAANEWAQQIFGQGVSRVHTAKKKASFFSTATRLYD
jgi:DNA primase